MFSMIAAAPTDSAFFNALRRKKNCASLTIPFTGTTTTESDSMAFSAALTGRTKANRASHKKYRFISKKSPSLPSAPQGILSLWD